MVEKNELLQNLPKVDKLLEDDRLKRLFQFHPRTLILDEIRLYLDEIRSGIMNETIQDVDNLDLFIDKMVLSIGLKLESGIKHCINGMGIILHTNLGRAPIAETAKQSLLQSLRNYCTLQINLETGKRGDRHSNVEKLLKRITGAEAALIVNNNAAATLLILNTLAEGKEVIVSRGELIEIGGSFRIPDVMQKSGAKLVEVGTTNRTHLKDYKEAINENTGLILKVHKSNYKILGFTKEVNIDELAPLAHEYNIIAVDDIGSGALVDLSKWGLPKEPTVQESVLAGADVVCFSGDKLIGGPQCGIIIGRKNEIDKIKKNQLMRALRCDKMTFAVLEATLRLFLDEKKLLESHPVLKMLTMPENVIKKRCIRLKKKIDPFVDRIGKISIEKEESEAGSGSLAGVTLPTWVLAIKPAKFSTEELAKKLRLSKVSVFGRIKEDRLLLDCRTVRDDELDLVAENFKNI